MEAIIESFHLDGKILLAQAINFAIVLFVLYKFAYKPLLKKMNERTEVIQKGLDDAKKTQEQLEEAEKVKEQKIKEAYKEAKEVMAEAQKKAEKNKQEITENAKKEGDKIMEEAKKQIKKEKQKMFKEVKSQVGELTVLALEKTLQKKVGKDGDVELVKESINELREELEDQGEAKNRG
ncbi:MAG: F0F1 ATP synthase subunit B [Candidatus Moranbacteria bacterium]|nr:F0F1 ATP synthase subunit B [Candidatus Moranbacteria bacterium]